MKNLSGKSNYICDDNSIEVAIKEKKNLKNDEIQNKRNLITEQLIKTYDEIKDLYEETPHKDLYDLKVLLEASITTSNKLN